MLEEQQLAMLNEKPTSLAEATERARRRMWMSSPTAITLRHEPDNSVTVEGPPRTALSRWAPLVLHTDHGVYPLFRDADLVIAELRELLPMLASCTGIVPASITVVTVGGTNVLPGLAMPRLRETHTQFFLRQPSKDEMDRMLGRWAARIVPLVAQLLEMNVVLGDIQPNNIMLDDHGDSFLVDPDSIFREASAEWLEPAVGVVSLIPKRLYQNSVRFHRDVLRYAMVFAALFSTLPILTRPFNAYPAWSKATVMRAHTAVVAGLTPQTRQLVDALLGDTTPMAARFGELVFAT